MTGGRIAKQKDSVKFVEIPASSFSWLSSVSVFRCPNIYTAAPKITSKPVGFAGFFVDGAAMFDARLNGNALDVMGWIPEYSQSIGATYSNFKCYAIVQET